MPIAIGDTVVLYPTVGTLNKLSSDTRDLSSTLLVSGNTPTSYSDTVVFYPSFSNPVFTRVSTFISSSNEPIVVSTANVATVTQTWTVS